MKFEVNPKQCRPLWHMGGSTALFLLQNTQLLSIPSAMLVGHIKTGLP